jgi:hypothetical protein
MYPYQLCPPLPQAGAGDYGVRKRSFRLMLKLRFSTPNGTACGSPLAHAEGLEVRAKEDVPYGRA